MRLTTNIWSLAKTETYCVQNYLAISFLGKTGFQKKLLPWTFMKTRNLIFFLEWLPSKARDSSLLCYINWGRKELIYTFSKSIRMKWTQMTKPEFEPGSLISHSSLVTVMLPTYQLNIKLFFWGWGRNIWINLVIVTYVIIITCLILKNYNDLFDAGTGVNYCQWGFIRYDYRPLYCK